MMLMDWPAFTEKVVGTPFVPYGRDYDGIDCWGLVWLGYRDVRGIELPHYSAEYAGLYEEAAGVAKWRRLVRIFNSGIKLWIPTNSPETGDLALIYRQGLVIHCGLVMPSRKILHVEERIETCQERMNRMHIEGTYTLDIPKVRALLEES